MGSCVVGEAVAQGIVNNETLGYFMARTYLFLMRVGIKPECLRFRQHLATEMAHYAADCWDAEIKLSYGWTECVGIADRACFDLKKHSEATNVEMTASVQYEKPVEKEIFSPDFNNKKIGMVFKKDQKIVKEFITKMGEEDTEACQKMIDTMTASGSAEIGPCANGAMFTITPEMVTFKKVIKRIHEEKFVPSVVEPSFGVGRLIYSILEHSFYIREDEEKRTVMAFKPAVAAIKCSIIPLNNSEQFNETIDTIGEGLRAYQLAFRTDASSASIGRRYARTDEIGIPFAITVDFDTLNKEGELYNTVTLRERDSMKQVRLPIEDVAVALNEIVRERKTWEDLLKKYPQVAVKEE